MANQDRNDSGKFAAKGDSIRAVRTMRLTDSTWNLLGEKAEEIGVSKADYLEGLFSEQIEWDSDDSEPDYDDRDDRDDKVVEILSNVLTSKERGNKHFKAAITEVLELMGHELEEE